MNNTTRLLSALVFVAMFGTTPAVAEIFTWIDENGRKHFGDRIPARYQNQTNPVDLEVYRPSETDVENAAKTDASIRQMNDALSARSPAAETASQSDVNSPGAFQRPKSVSKEAYAKMSDQQQQQAYAQSQSCFNACADVSPRGFMNDNLPPVRNMANCGHCTDLPPPRSTRPR